MEKRILIVACDRETRERLARAFADPGFRVATAFDGVNGLFKFGLVQPDLVVLDLCGWETLQRFRSLSDVPIIALIDDNPVTRIESLNLGADFFVIKPPCVQELLAKTRALLRRGSALRAQAVA